VIFGAAAAIRQRIGVVRFKIYDAGYEVSAAALRDASEQLNVTLRGSSARAL
jgi:hypothetical protein